jgi:hypothetical protein
MADKGKKRPNPQDLIKPTGLPTRGKPTRSSR